MIPATFLESWILRNVSSNSGVRLIFAAGPWALIKYIQNSKSSFIKKKVTFFGLGILIFEEKKSSYLFAIVLKWYPLLLCQNKKFDQYYDDTESIALYKTCNHA